MSERRTLAHVTASGRASYEVGRGILAEAAAIISIALGDRRASGVLMVVDEAVNGSGLWGDQVAQSIARDALLGQVPCERVAIRVSESAKSMEEWRMLLARALAMRLDRDGIIVAIGGGVVTDLAGFAAATYLRGVRWIAVPTTLLAMVDAALGGKTGINLSLPDGGMGKNLAGAFWPPSAIIGDVQALSTLPERELRAGLAECIKHALIAGSGGSPPGESRPGESPPGRSLSTFQSSGKSVMSARDDFLRDLVVESAQVKLDIVAKDEREEGIRRHLNLGHTFAHAIEARGCDGLSHGEAVAVGLVAAAAAAVASGRMRPEQAVSIKQRVSEAGLPVALVAPVSAASLLEAARADKKGSRGTLRLVLPLASGGVEVVADEDGQLFMVGLAAIGAS